MTTNAQEVFAACCLVAPRLKKPVLTPHLLFAVCDQECYKDKKKPGVWRPDVARLEQRFYEAYIREMNYDSVTEGTLATSWGVMQMMGESLREIGYFREDFARQSPAYRERYGDPRVVSFEGKPEPELSEVNVPKALNRLLENLEAQIYWGGLWLIRKMKVAGSERPEDFLLCWNGGARPQYVPEVMERERRAREKFKTAR